MMGQDHIALNRGRVKLDDEKNIYVYIFTSATHLHILLVCQLSKISAQAHTKRGTICHFCGIIIQAAAAPLTSRPTPVYHEYPEIMVCTLYIHSTHLKRKYKRSSG